MMKAIASIDESAIGDCIGMTPSSSEWSCVVVFGDGFTMFHEFCMVSGSVIHTLLKVVNFTVCSIVSCVRVQIAIPIGVSFYGIVVALCVIVIVIPAPSRKPISAFVLYRPQFKSVCALSTHVLRHTPFYCNEVIGNVIEPIPNFVSIIVFHPCCPPFDIPRANPSPFLAVHNNHYSSPKPAIIISYLSQGTHRPFLTLGFSQSQFWGIKVREGNRVNKVSSNHFSEIEG